MASKTSSGRKTGSRAKRIRKRTSQKSKSTEVVYHSTKEIKVERALIENFIGLQKVMVNLSSKFDSLSNQISNLLQLFEVSAKSLARKEISLSEKGESLEAGKIMEKLDHLSAQAGLIGKGLSLIHEVRTENERPIPLNNQRNRPQVRVSPERSEMNSEAVSKMTEELAGFEKSITAKGRETMENAA